MTLANYANNRFLISKSNPFPLARIDKPKPRKRKSQVNLDLNSTSFTHNSFGIPESANLLKPVVLTIQTDWQKRFIDNWLVDTYPAHAAIRTEIPQAPPTSAEFEKLQLDKT
jgi:hypothetical protein